MRGGYFRSLVVFGIAAVIAVSALLLFILLLPGEGFTERRAIALLRNHDSAVDPEDFHELEVDGRLEMVSMDIFGGDIAIGNITVSTFGGREAIMLYDTDGKIIYAHILIANISVPKIIPTEVWNCTGGELRLASEQRKDHLFFAMTGSKLVNEITERVLEDISKPLYNETVPETITQGNVTFSVSRAMEAAKANVQLLAVWYYNPEKRAYYEEHMAEVKGELGSDRCRKLQ